MDLGCGLEDLFPFGFGDFLMGETLRNSPIGFTPSPFSETVAIDTSDDSSDMSDSSSPSVNKDDLLGSFGWKSAIITEAASSLSNVCTLVVVVESLLISLSGKLCGLPVPSSSGRNLGLPTSLGLILFLE